MEMMTLTEASALVHLQPVTLRRYCARGMIGRKYGKTWLLSHDDIERIKAMPAASHKAGRPRKS